MRWQVGQALLGRWLGSLGALVGRRPLPFVLIPLGLALLSLLGLLRFHLTKEFEILFVPPDSRSMDEAMAHERFPSLGSTEPSWLDSGQGESEWLPTQSCGAAGIANSSMVVFVSRLDGRSVLQGGLLEFVGNVSANFSRDFRFTDDAGLSRDFASDLCAPCDGKKQACDRNGWLRTASVIFSERLRHSPNIGFQFPLLKLYGETVDLSPLMLGANFTLDRHDAETLILHFSIFYEQSDLGHDDLHAMRAAFEAYWTKLKGAITEDSDLEDSDDRLVTEDVFDMFGHCNRMSFGGLSYVGVPVEAFEDEAERMAGAIAGFVPLSFGLLAALLLLYALPGRCPSTRPLEAMAALVSVLLALVASLGLMAAFAFPFNPIIAVSPYLILAIGVDDSFLILGAWSGDLRATMAEVGPAIAVTTATDALTFLVGAALSQTPAMADFCLFTAVALILDFAFQVSFFVAVLQYTRRLGRRLGSCVEAAGKVLPSDLAPRLSIIPHAKGYEIRGRSGCSSSSSLDSSPKGGTVGAWLGSSYTAFLLQPWVRLTAAVAYLVYVVVAVRGCSDLTIDIDPKKLTLKGDSPINGYFDLASSYIYREFVPAHIYSFAPPQPGDPSAVAAFLDLVYQLEDLPLSLGSAGTDLWLRDFILDSQESPGVPLTARLHNFFAEERFRRHRAAVKFAPNGSVSAFSARLYYTGLDTWEERASLLANWRRLSDEFRRFDVHIYTPQALYVDQFSVLGPSALQTVGCGILAMCVVGAAFTPQPIAIFFVSSSVLSIAAGVMGFAALGGGEIDHVSLGSFLTSIGLAIDFSVHVSIRFNHYEATDQSPDERLASTLASVGWPLVQAGTSSLVGVGVLALAPSYVAAVFARTVGLVMGLGLLHGLLWLPLAHHASAPRRRDATSSDGSSIFPMSFEGGMPKLGL